MFFDNWESIFFVISGCIYIKMTEVELQRLTYETDEEDVNVDDIGKIVKTSNIYNCLKIT